MGSNGQGTVFAGTLSGGGSLTTVGGMLTLAGNSSYSGATNVTAGTLAVNGSLGQLGRLGRGGAALAARARSGAVSVWPTRAPSTWSTVPSEHSR